MNLRATSSALINPMRPDDAPAGRGLKLLCAALVGLTLVWSAATPIPAYAQSDVSVGGDEEGFSMEKAWETVKSRFDAGGPTMWAILFASTIGLASMLERLFRLRKKAFVPDGFAPRVNQLWKEGKYDEVEQLALANRKSILGKIVLFIVRKRDSSVEQINEAIGEIAGREMTTHQMFAYPMVAVATICPLFGLLGTVLGIIDTFEQIAVAGAMGDPSIMARGISQALVCTAFGLVVAIPMLFIYHIIKLRTQYLNGMMEEEASFLMSDWFMKGKEVRA